LNWKRDLNNNISDCPLICDYNGSVYIGARGAQMSLIAFNSSGDLLWEINDLQNGVGGSPAIGFSELLYFPTWESEKIYCIK
jgi:outer membrane protein assembly factor BamB